MQNVKTKSLVLKRQKYQERCRVKTKKKLTGDLKKGPDGKIL